MEFLVRCSSLKISISLLLLFGSVSASAACNCNNNNAPVESLNTSPWQGSSAQAGIVSNTGNSDTTAVNGGFNLQYTKQPWADNLQGNGQWSRSLGEVTQEQYFLQNQLNYSFDNRNFLFNNLNYTDNHFSPYTSQFVGSVGYGHVLINTEKVNLTLQAGPGLRYNTMRLDGSNESYPIGTAASNLNWQISKTCLITEQVTYNFGQPYDYLKSVAAITNKIIGNLAIQLSYTLEYYSNIPLGSSNTKNLDTTTNLSLVYNF